MLDLGPFPTLDIRLTGGGLWAVWDIRGKKGKQHL